MGWLFRFRKAHASHNDLLVKKPTDAAKNVKGGNTSNSVSVRADARQHVTQKRADTTDLQRALSSIHGIVRANDVVVAASHDEALTAALTLLATKCLLLQQASYKASLHKANITTISNLFVELLNNLSDSQNQVALISCASSDEHQLASLLKRISAAASDANKLACSCQDPGWLARLARSDVVLEQFQMIAKAVAALLHSQSSVPKLNISTEFQWIEVSSEVRSILRDVGDGVVERGIARLGQEQYRSSTAVQQLSALLNVPIEAILEESRNVGLASLGVEIITDDKLRRNEVDRIFHEYAKSCPDALTEAEFNDVLLDMGLLDDVIGTGKNESQRGKAVELFVSADSDFDRVVGFSEFQRFFIKYPITGIRAHLRLSTSLKTERSLYQTFCSFQGRTSPRVVQVGQLVQRKGACLDSMHFAKLCRDAKLLSENFTLQHLDVLFTSITKTLARPRLDFDNFLVALQAIGDKRDLNFDMIVQMVIKAEQPHYERNGTQAEYVALHDDPSKISGIHARGGPSHGPTNVDMQAFVQRYSTTCSSSSPRSLQTPKKHSKPSVTVVTTPVSPRLATALRVESAGPVTPGRGASLAAIEAKAKALGGNSASNHSPSRGSPSPGLGRRITRSPTSRPSRLPAGPPSPSTGGVRRIRLHATTPSQIPTIYTPRDITDNFHEYRSTTTMTTTMTDDGDGSCIAVGQ